jgi:hypothetical protein
MASGSTVALGARSGFAAASRAAFSGGFSDAGVSLVFFSVDLSVAAPAFSEGVGFFSEGVVFFSAPSVVLVRDSPVASAVELLFFFPVDPVELPDSPPPSTFAGNGRSKDSPAAVLLPVVPDFAGVFFWLFVPDDDFFFAVVELFLVELFAVAAVATWSGANASIAPTNAAVIVENRNILRGIV